MFRVDKPEFGLVIGDILTYRCEGHALMYKDLQMNFNDGFLTYERKHRDNGWQLKTNNKIKQLDIRWNSTMRYLIGYLLNIDVFILVIILYQSTHSKYNNRSKNTTNRFQ